ANATAKSSYNATQPAMYRGRAIAPSSNSSATTDIETSTVSLPPQSEAFSSIAGIIRDIAALPDANATAKSSFNATQPVMYRGRAIAPSSNSSESSDIETSTVTLPPQFDSPFPHLFAAPEHSENPNSSYLVC
ncbi:MAG: hypothetical protein AAF974_02055, partial [Cyanobacteria bacterium P01_E01_bin.34]